MIQKWLGLCHRQVIASIASCRIYSLIHASQHLVKKCCHLHFGCQPTLELLRSCIWPGMFSMYDLVWVCGCDLIYCVCMLYLFYSRTIAYRANVICCTVPDLNKIYLILSFFTLSKTQDPFHEVYNWNLENFSFWLKWFSWAGVTCAKLWPDLIWSDDCMSCWRFQWCICILALCETSLWWGICHHPWAFGGSKYMFQ